MKIKIIHGFIGSLILVLAGAVLLDCGIRATGMASIGCGVALFTFGPIIIDLIQCDK